MGIMHPLTEMHHLLELPDDVVLFLSDMACNPAFSTLSRRLWNLLAYRYLIGSDLRDTNPNLFQRLCWCHGRVRVLKDCKLGNVCMNSLGSSQQPIQYVSMSYFDGNPPVQWSSPWVRKLQGPVRLHLRNQECVQAWSSSFPNGMGSGQILQLTAHGVGNGFVTTLSDLVRLQKLNIRVDNTCRTMPSLCTQLVLRLLQLTCLQELRLGSPFSMQRRSGASERSCGRHCRLCIDRRIARAVTPEEPGDCGSVHGHRGQPVPLGRHGPWLAEAGAFQPECQHAECRCYHPVCTASIPQPIVPLRVRSPGGEDHHHVPTLRHVGSEHELRGSS